MPLSSLPRSPWSSDRAWSPRRRCAAWTRSTTWHRTSIRTRPGSRPASSSRLATQASPASCSTPSSTRRMRRCRTTCARRRPRRSAPDSARGDGPAPSGIRPELLDAALSGRMAVPYSIRRSVHQRPARCRRGRRAGPHRGGARARNLRAVWSRVPQRAGAGEHRRRRTRASGRCVADLLEAWTAGPLCGVRAAREDLLAMFRAYDGDGLTGDATDLERLLGRPATPWRVTVERAAQSSSCIASTALAR